MFIDIKHKTSLSHESPLYVVLQDLNDLSSFRTNGLPTNGSAAASSPFMSSADYPVFFPFIGFNIDETRISYRVSASDYPSIAAARQTLAEIVNFVLARLPHPRIRVHRISFHDLPQDRFVVDIVVSSSPPIELDEVSSLLNPYTRPPLEN